MKRKHTNNKHYQFTVISVVTTVVGTIFMSSSLTFRIGTQYKLLRIVSTQAVGSILTKTFGTRRFISKKVGHTWDQSQIAETNLLHSIPIFEVASQQYRD